MHVERANRILKALDRLDARQMLITDPMSILYLTDIYVQPFERFFGLLLRVDGNHVLFLNKLFFVPQDVGIEKVWYSDTDPVTDIVAKYLDHSSPLAVDKDLTARHLLPLMGKRAAASFINGSPAVDYTRGIKDAEEQKKMIAASEINDAAMAQFKTLPGDCVLFDVGCIKDGYCSDMTRTFYFKEVSEHCREIYHIVRRANEAAEALIRPGVRLCDIDAAARDLITKEGYGPQFNHRLGHFIGLKEHEYGDVSSGFDWPVQPGMIFSIEPGIYLAGDTGVRIEDLVLVTEDGVKILNRYPHELEIIG